MAEKDENKILVIITICIILIFIGFNGCITQEDNENNEKLITNGIFKICKGSEPVFSPDGTKILFINNFIEEDPNEIYLINTNGKGLKKILKTNLDDRTFSINPNNSKILYHKYDMNHGYSEIWLVNVDGTNNHLLKKGYHASFSPNGNQILYAVEEIIGNYKLEDNMLRIMDLNGSNDKLIMKTHSPNLIWRPTFFPDGQRILFSIDDRSAGFERSYNNNSSINDTFKPGLWVIDINGNNSKYLTNYYGSSFRSPRTKVIVSKNGEKILYYGGTHAHSQLLFVYDLNEMNEIQVKDPSYLYGADISRDSKNITWADDESLWISNINGTEIKPLARGYNPHFSPIDDIIVFEDGKVIYSCRYK